MIKKLLIAVLLATIPISLLAGFAGDTLVAIPSSKFQSIQDFKVNDYILGFNKQSKLIITYVENVLEQQNQEYVQLTIGNQKIITAKSQTFLNFTTNKWIKAKNLQIGDKVCIAKKPWYLTVKNIHDDGDYTNLYEIRVENIHVFCITQDLIVVHNIGLLGLIGASINFTLLFDSVATIATTATAIITWEIGLPLACAYIAITLTDNKSTQTTIGANAAGIKVEKHFNHTDCHTPEELALLCENYPDPYLMGSMIPCNSNKQYPAQNTPQTSCTPTIQENHQPPTEPCSPPEYIPTIHGVICLPDHTIAHDGDFGCFQPATIQIDHVTPLQPDSINNQTECNRTTEKASMVKKEDAESKPRQTHSYPESQHEPGKKCETDDCNPPAKGPHGYFIPSEKHKSKPNGDASAGPATWEEGQNALDNSVPALDKYNKPTKQRVGVHDGKIIVFKNTVNDVWHGYYSEWDDLDPELKRGLIQKNLTNNKGKIL